MQGVSGATAVWDPLITSLTAGTKPNIPLLVLHTAAALCQILSEQEESRPPCIRGVCPSCPPPSRAVCRVPGSERAADVCDGGGRQSALLSSD